MFSSKSIATTFFEETTIAMKGTRTITTFVCKCGVTRSQDLKKGYVNLLSHIKENHLDWEDIMKSKKTDQLSMDAFIDKQSTNVFNWLDWIVMKNLAFEMVEDERTRKMSKWGTISVTTLRKYLYLVTEAVENIVSN